MRRIISIALIFDKMILRTYKLLLIPALINMVATILSPLFGFIFYVDTNNQYIRGDNFFIFIIVYIINFLFLVITTFEVGKKCNYPIMCKLVALSLFIILGTSIQLVYPIAYSSWHSVTLSLLLYFLLMSEFDSSFDTLTNLYNRAAFDKATKQMAAKKAFSIFLGEEKLDFNKIFKEADNQMYQYKKIHKANAAQDMTLPY